MSDPLQCQKNRIALIQKLEEYAEIIEQTAHEYERLIQSLRETDISRFHPKNAENIASRIQDIQEDAVTTNYFTRELTRQLKILRDTPDLLIPESEREPRSPPTKQEIQETIARFLLLETSPV